MKIKLLFLTIASLLLTYLIFTTNIDNRLDIVSLYDTTTTTRPNFNDYLLKYLDNNVSYSINQKYSNKNLEIENVISNINSNKKQWSSKSFETLRPLKTFLNDIKIRKDDKK